MSDCKEILLRLIQFYLTLQFVFILFCLTLNWQSDYEKKDICYLILKAIQYLIHIVFYKKKDDERLKYHICYYFLMDIYGLFLVEMKALIFWIILSQLLIGAIVLGCILVYFFLCIISSYQLHLFSCGDRKPLDNLLWYYLILFIFVTLISCNLFQFFEYSAFDCWYLIVRVAQYIITFFLYEKEGKEVAQVLHYIVDTLLNICGLLYLQYDNYFFWVILSQIALGCFHYCYILIFLVLSIICKYYSLAYHYLQYRLTRFISNNYDQYIENCVILYIITQLAFTLYICIKYFEQTVLNMPFYELNYLFMRAIQYSFHLIYHASEGNFFRHFDCHFNFYFIMDVYGLIILKLQSQIIWIIFFQIILGFIVYYLLCIEIIKMSYEKTKLENIHPLVELIISVIMLELCISILVFKLEQQTDSYYLLFRIALYIILFVLIVFENKILDSFPFIILVFVTLLGNIFIFVWGLKLVIYQGQVNFFNLQQLFFDLIWIGALSFPYNQEKDEDLIKIWRKQADYYPPPNFDFHKFEKVFWWT